MRSYKDRTSWGLGLLTLLAFWPSFSADFINFDDPTYTYENPHVRSGLTLANAKWAFTTFHASNWHPLTWISLQVDAQLFNLNPAGYHATNVIIHLMNVVLLFHFLFQLTGHRGRSWLVASIFAVHPLRVESVAWVAERKDVLSSFFGLAALLCYVAYVRRPSGIRYMAILGMFALSLLSKPTWVTFPAQLLLLDYWPLRRVTAHGKISAPIQTPDPVHDMGLNETGTRTTSWVWLIVEKLPFAALSLISCMVTIWAQRDALKTLEHVQLSTRLANAIVAYVNYLKLTIAPMNLALFYPYTSVSRDWTLIAGCSILLFAITMGLIRQGRRRPALIVGWFWFLGTLIPMIGIVQVGAQAYADRYTYVPHIGLLVTLVWFADDCCQRFGFPATGKKLVGTIIIVIGIFLTWKQLGYWRNSETLWRHVLAVAPENAVALNNFGTEMARRGKHREAAEYFERAIRLQPGAAAGHFNLGNALKDLGQPARAEQPLRDCLELDQEYPGANQALGVTLAMLGRFDDARDYLVNATRQDPENGSAWFNLGAILADQGKYAEAIPALSNAVARLPMQASAHLLLASAEYETGDFVSASKNYREAVRIDPNWIFKSNRNAWMLATSNEPKDRNGRRALQLARRVCQATEFRQPEYLDTLAAAYAETGRFSEALATVDAALKLFVEFSVATDFVVRLRSRRDLYSRHKPFHESKLPH